MLGRSSDVPPGSAIPLTLCGQEMVAFRTHEGDLVVLDGHCAHLGAHLGWGGAVDGNGIRCPFHRWRYDHEGRCDDIPYLSTGATVPDVALPVWPVLEHHGFVFVYHDRLRRPPTWHPTPRPELLDGPWSPFTSVSHDVQIHCQDVIENLADTVHFQYIHGMPSIPRAEVSEAGPIYYHTMVGEVDGEERYRNYFTAMGLGILWLYMPDTRMFILTTTTPLTEEITRFTLWFTAWEGPGGISPTRRENLEETIAESTYRDVPIWEHRRYPDRPRLIADDGPIPVVQRWARQFYE